MGPAQSSPQKETSRRASRFERPEKPSTLILQPRDREILAAVYGHRFLSSSQIRDMFFGCTTRSNTRMKKLWENQYLDRHYLRPLAFHGSSQAIYSLGQRGVDIVTESLGIDRAEVKRNRDKDCQINPFFIEHILSINDFRISFQEAVERHTELQFERWINERDIQDEYRLHRNGRVIRHRIRPDGYGRYWYKEKLYSFFLELDRSTETDGKFEGKVRSYVDYSRSGRYYQTFGVRFFRVLAVTTTARRLSNLKRITEGIADGLFWFVTLDEIREGKMFDVIWLRAGQEGTYSLLEGNQESQPDAGKSS